MIDKLLRPAFALVIAVAVAFIIVNAQKARSPNGNAFSDSTTTQQPLVTDYRGVRIGMTADEVQAKFGKGMRIDEQEFFVFNERETLQIAYDKTNKVMGISVDFLGGVGAPDYRMVVGPDITVRPDGSMYKMVRYDQLGFWVSYNRTSNHSVLMVTITIQKFLDR
jgi:hypothetical protein